MPPKAKHIRQSFGFVFSFALQNYCGAAFARQAPQSTLAEMPYFFTSESVSEGHPDKIADQISDAILDAMLAQDPDSRVACETLVTTGLVVVAGEVTTNAWVDIHEVVRKTIAQIGYTKAEYMFEANSAGLINSLHGQSPDIAQGVDKQDKLEQGAGDQGMMFGYATNETREFMPMALAYAHRLVKRLSTIRKENAGIMPYLRPDAKSQVTIEYGDDHRPRRVDTIVISTQHDPAVYAANASDADKKAADDQLQAQIRQDIIEHVIRKEIDAQWLDENTKIHINPTGKFVIGGPHGDTGLTGRKIIVDTYGGKGAHGGGAFSGKDPSKVDRSAAYAARHIAKNMVAAGVAHEVLVQVAYAIGKAEPVSLFVDTFNTAQVQATDGEIAARISKLFDLRPAAIIDRLKLKNPIYSATAAYGHMGREPEMLRTTLNPVELKKDGGVVTKITRSQEAEVELFTWEKLDYADAIKKEFSL